MLKNGTTGTGLVEGYVGDAGLNFVASWQLKAVQCRL